MRIFRPILFLIALALLLVSVRQFMNGYNDWQQAQLAEEAYRAEIQGIRSRTRPTQAARRNATKRQVNKGTPRQKTTRLYQAG